MKLRLHIGCESDQRNSLPKAEWYKKSTSSCSQEAWRRRLRVGALEILLKLDVRRKSTKDIAHPRRKVAMANGLVIMDHYSELAP